LHRQSTRGAISGGRDWVPRHSEALVELVQGAEVALVELEVLEVGVFLDAPGRVRLGEGDEALLQGPPDEDLGDRDVVLLRELHESWVVEALSSENRAVGCARGRGAVSERSEEESDGFDETRGGCARTLDDDALLLAKLHDRLLLKEWVELDLCTRRTREIQLGSRTRKPFERKRAHLVDLGQLEACLPDLLEVPNALQVALRQLVTSIEGMSRKG